MAIYGGIEGGGTKFICIIAENKDTILDEVRFPTTSPEETIGKALAFFKKHIDAGVQIKRIGLATFGPIDPVIGSSSYGMILPTPKAGWSNYDIVGALYKELNIPIVFDTDVNGAALSETEWGAGKGANGVLYITIGTGIGGGYYVNGKLLHGLLHPEMGHIRIPHDLVRDPFAGNCPFHGDCFEGLANGPALEKRWGVKAETLPKDHPAWALEAEYIAQALVNFILTLSPQKIIIGGGVAQQEQIMPMVQARVTELLNGYVQSELVKGDIKNYIVLPGLGENAGKYGALALAMFNPSE